MKSLLLSFALLAGMSVRAAEGYVTKSASGTTSATVLFPAGPPLRITAYDVTADNATNRLIFQSGTVGATVAKAAASSATSVTFLKTTFVTNNQVFFQDASENTAVGIVATNGTVTNKLISLANAIGTNLAAGDAVAKILSAPYRVIARTPSGTGCFVDNLAGIAAADVLVLDRGPSLPLTSDAVNGVATNGRSYVTLKTRAARDVTAGDAVYEQLTNKTVTLAGTVGTNTLTVNTTNGIVANGLILHETALGSVTVYTVTNFTGTTNLLITPPLVEASTVNDYVFVLHPTSYTATLPARAGDPSLVLSAATALASNDVIVVKSTGAATWRANLAATPASTNIYTLDLLSGFGVASDVPHVVYKTTNSTTTVLAASRNDFTVVTSIGTNFAAGERLLITPASGGLFQNSVLGTPQDYALTTIGFTAQTGVALAVGDSVYLLGTTNNTLVGAATLRGDGQALYSVERGKPLKVMITGAAACSLNSVTGKYD